MTTVETRPAEAAAGDPAELDRWAVDDAIEVLPWDAPEALWLAARREGLGGSDTSAVFGLNQYNSPISLWLEKTGRHAEEVSGNAVEWGRRLEPVVAEWFTDETGIETRRCGLLRSLDDPILQCTPDRLTADGGLEIKTLEWYSEDEWADGQVPDHAEMQAQKCMLVTGRRHWWVVGLVNGRWPLLRLVERDEELIETIRNHETAWWRDYVVADEMPPLDDSVATAEALGGWIGPDDGGVIAATPEMLALWDELEAAKERVSLAEAAVVGIQSRITLAVGPAAVVALDPDGELDTTKVKGKANVIATARNNGTFSTKRFTAAHPEIAAATRAMVEKLDTKTLQTKFPAEYHACRARVLRTRSKALADAINARRNTPGSK